MPWKFLVIGYRYYDSDLKTDPYTVAVVPCKTMLDCKRIFEIYVLKFRDVPNTYFKIFKLTEV